MTTRRTSSVVRVGDILIGGQNPICIQSMTTTSTLDTIASVAQVKRIVDAGGQLVRLTTQGQREAANMADISQALHREGYNIPLVADVHFNASVADIAATTCAKVRINPGNYLDPARRFIRRVYSDEEYASELQKIEERFTTFLRICRENSTAIRIGVNHGSLSDRIRNRYGDTPQGIVESCMEFLRICRKEAFDNVVLSIKASNTVVMVDAVHRLIAAMDNEDMHYPLHLGVTEAGEGEDGRVKSAVGIGALLTEGIGDTIRVSLSEPPEAEIPVAKKIVAFTPECAHRRQHADISSSGTLHLTFDEDSSEDLLLKAAMTAGGILISGQAKDLVVENHGVSDNRLALTILQAARVKFTKTDFISCPGCGRTLYDLQTTIAKIKTALAKAAQTNKKINSLKIGIMGCIVNGPGEMADADYGYVGAGVGKVALYKGRECVEKDIPENEAVEKLLALIARDS